MDHNASVPLPHHDFPEFGNSSWTPEEEAKIQRLLEENVGMEEAQYRDGPAGTTLAYVATQHVLNEANRIFGVGGWSSTVKLLQQDFLEEVEGKYYCGYSATLRVTLKDGSYRDDVGYGTGENIVPALAIGHGKKGAVSDALKRVLRQFGNKLGNCLSDKSYADSLTESRPTPLYNKR